MEQLEDPQRDLTEEITKLKSRYRGSLLILGSGKLVRSLLEKGLLDELRLAVYPVVLGRGERLFQDASGEARFELVESSRTATGVVLSTYRPLAQYSPVNPGEAGPSRS